MIPLDDRGLLLGDGLFETILALDGRLVWMEAHVARLARGCARLGLPAPGPAEANTLALEAIATGGLQAGRAAVRLTLTAGSGGRGLDRPATPSPRLFATAASAGPPPESLSLATSTVRRNEGSPASRLKTLAYLDNVLARAEARAAGAGEALMLNGAGEVACAAAANIFWIEAGQLFTPALEAGVLDGIARDRVLAAAGRIGLEAVQTRQGPEALARAEAAFLTNSLMGAVPVSRLDGRTLADSPLRQRLAQALYEVQVT